MKKIRMVFGVGIATLIGFIISTNFSAHEDQSPGDKSIGVSVGLDTFDNCSIGFGFYGFQTEHTAFDSSHDYHRSDRGGVAQIDGRFDSGDRYVCRFEWDCYDSWIRIKVVNGMVDRVRFNKSDEFVLMSSDGTEGTTFNIDPKNREIIIFITRKVQDRSELMSG